MKNSVSKSTQGLFAVLILGLSLGSGLVGCTKKKELQNRVDPDFYVSKSDFDGRTFQMVRGIEDADSNNDIGAVPGFSEDLGLVRVRITETELQFLSAYDPTNREATMPIMASFPIVKHFDVIREKNDYNEETNHVVEDTQQAWNKRKFMRVNWSKPANRLAQLGSLGRKKDSSFGGDESNGGGLVEENTTLLQDPKIEKEDINWVVESNFSGNGSVTFVYPFGYEQAASARVTYRVHLLPARNTDFKPRAYTMKDFTTFGFFTTQQNFENPQKGFLDRDIKSYANVFNVCEASQNLSCAKNQIVWVLSKDFPERFVSLSEKAVSQWNTVFQKALNRTDDVVVLDTKTRVDISDPTHNVIAYYKPKANGGLLGVAQSVDDPRTGERRVSRATVYEDGINSVMGSIDDFLDLVERDPEAAKAVIGETGVSLASLKGLSVTDFENDGSNAGTIPHLQVGSARVTDGEVLGGLSLEGRKRRQSQVSKMGSAVGSRMASNGLRGSDALKQSMTLNLKKLRGNATRSKLRKQNLMASHPELFASNELDRIASIFGQGEADQADGGFAFQIPVVNLSGRADARAAMTTGALAPAFKATHGLIGLSIDDAAIRAQKAIALRQSAAGVHGAEFVEEATLRYLAKLARKHANISDLVELREKIKEDVAASTFYMTLLHEMGHSFGLRHNFIASADHDHYTPEYFELKKKMDAGDKSITQADLEPFAYSSIMDYGADFFSQDVGLGPYDYAAIRYGYNRSPDPKTEEIAKSGFLFCTDHQLNEDIRCRQFDRGATVSEITLNEINRFENNWVLSHLRRGRATFGNSVKKYPMRALGRMTNIRQVMDEFFYQLSTTSMTPSPATECDEDLVRNSVAAGEMGNICDPEQAKRFGITPGDPSTFAKALVNPETHELQKKYTDYKPGGFADLIFANNEALKFFRRVIGNPEPGVFLAVPTTEGEPFRLKRLASGSDEEINAIAETQKAVPATEWAAAAKSNIARIPLGRVGHPFYTSSSKEGGVTKAESIGSFIDKYVALMALARTTIGVDKYLEASMSGSALQFAQSAPAVDDLVTSMIALSPDVATANLQLANGNYVKAFLPASFDGDTQINALVTSLTDLVTDQDPGMLERLRVCTENEQGCLPTFGAVAEFVSASGQRKYRAAQTADSNSIAYLLVSRAAVYDQKRQALIKEDATKNAGEIAALTSRIARQEVVIRTIRSLMVATHSE